MVEKIPTPFDAIGEETFICLIDAFYRRVGTHPYSRSRFFLTNYNGNRSKTKQFMTQYLGGPPLYTSEHGHPMLSAEAHAI